MKKLLVLATAAFLVTGVAFAGEGKDGKEKKECSKDKKECCKKGGKKSCCKKDSEKKEEKTEAKKS